MSDYKIWKPEHDGHAPPNWREGMPWDCEPFNKDGLMELIGNPSWYCGSKYKVPAEALNSPNDDDAQFVEAWKRNEALKELTRLGQEMEIDEAVSLIRKLPAEELAKHGITLAPERDWATELWADLFAVRGLSDFAKFVRKGRTDDDDRAAIELLRTRFEQMIAERSKRDA